MSFDDHPTILKVTWTPTITVQRGDEDAKTVDTGLLPITGQVNIDLSLGTTIRDVPLVARLEAQGLLDDVAQFVRTDYTDPFEDAVLEALGVSR